jgi:hypothetical protein
LIFEIAALIVPMQNASAHGDMAAMNLIALSQLYAASGNTSAAADASRKAYWGPFSVTGEGTAK